MKALAEPVATREGYELVEVEYVMDRGRPVVRLYIDTIPPGDDQRGVTVDDCAVISRRVGEALDAEDPVAGEYSLEVSSPGLYRPLTKVAHYQRVLGQRVKVKTYEKLEGRKVFTGELLDANEERITVKVDGVSYPIALEDVAKANLEPELEF